MSYLFRSERLGFRNWLDADIPKMAAISSDEDVMEFFPWLATFEQTRDFVLKMQEMFDERDYCYFAVDLLEENKFNGFIGLAYQVYEAPFTPCVDIDWRLAKEFWGKGYATEGASRCLSYAFEDLGIEEIKSTAPRMNLPSLNVMKKIGMSMELEFTHSRLPQESPLADFLCYGISRDIIKPS